MKQTNKKREKPLDKTEQLRKAKDRNKKREANHDRREKRNKKMNTGVQL
jgi:hypothetical protein